VIKKKKKKLVLPDVGAKVWIEAKIDGKLETYNSRVEDIREDRIVLAAPMYKGTVVKITTGKVNVRFVSKDALYVFEGKILEQRSMPVPLLVVAIPETVKREQRREYVRVPWLIVSQFLYHPELKTLKNKDYQSFWEEHMFDIFDGVIKDISGGGIRFNVSKKFVEETGISKDSILLVKFNLDFRLMGNEYNKEFIEKIRIVRDVPLLNKLNKEYGAMFVNIPDRNRDFIIKAVLQRQRELIKKGVLQ